MEGGGLLLDSEIPGPVAPKRKGGGFCYLRIWDCQKRIPGRSGSQFWTGFIRLLDMADSRVGNSENTNIFDHLGVIFVQMPPE